MIRRWKQKNSSSSDLNKWRGSGARARALQCDAARWRAEHTSSPCLSRNGAIPNSTRNVTMQPDISDGTAALMMFGYGPDGEAVLDRIIEQDRDLIDGVIPYDPQPTAVPPPSGTSFTLASCQYPAGFIDEPVAYRSYHRIVERLEASAGIKPRFSAIRRRPGVCRSHRRALRSGRESRSLPSALRSMAASAKRSRRVAPHSIVHAAR